MKITYPLNLNEEMIILRQRKNSDSPRCAADRCFAYWDGKCSALTDCTFKEGCPFFKDKEEKRLEDIRCRKRVKRWKAEKRKRLLNISLF